MSVKALFLGGWASGQARTEELARTLFAESAVSYIAVSPHQLSLADSRNAREQMLRRLIQDFSPDVLAGWSLGACLALEYAESYPSEVDRLILLSSTPEFIAGPINPDGVSRSAHRALRSRVRRERGPALRRFFETAGFPGYDAQALESTVAQAADISDSSLLAGLAVLEQFSVGTDTAVGDIPSLLIHGARDAIISLRSAELLHSLCSASHFVAIQDGSHLLLEQKGDIIAREVRSFLEDANL